MSACAMNQRRCEASRSANLRMPMVSWEQSRRSRHYRVSGNASYLPHCLAAHRERRLRSVHADTIWTNRQD